MLAPAILFVDTGLAGAGAKLAESVIEEAGIKLEEDFQNMRSFFEKPF